MEWPERLASIMWETQVANAHRDAFLVARPEVRTIGPRTASQAELDQMTHDAANSGFNADASMDVIPAMDPTREALGLPLLLCTRVSSASPEHLRVLWVITLLDGVPTNWVFDVPKHAFCELPRAPA